LFVFFSCFFCHINIIQLAKSITNKQSAANNSARFRALVMASSDIAYQIDPDWTLIGEFDEYGSIPHAQQTAAAWLSEQVYAADHVKFKDMIERCIAAKQKTEFEYRLPGWDHTRQWACITAVPIVDNKGQIIEWFALVIDISERKRTEESLRETIAQSNQQERLYEAITSGTPDLIYVFDLDYRFSYANAALLSMWGKTADEAIGKNLLENGYEPWHAEMHEREIDLVKMTKRPIRGEVSFPHAELGRRIYDYIFTPVVNERGEVEAVAGTTRDITDIRNAETAISESEARFRSMAESTEVMISVGDEMGNALYFNEAWAAATGLTPAALLKDGWRDLIHPDDKNKILDSLYKALTDKNPWACEFRLADGKGGYRWVMTRATQRFRSDGSFAGFISSTVDITEIKENEQRKNDFISMVSHELKTPLTSITSYVQVSQKRAIKNNDGPTADLLERARKQLSKMAGMINGFLDVSRLESGKIHMNRHSFDVSVLLQEAEEETLATISTHHVLFKPAAPICVDADREKIGQVINNLISNAVKYSPVGSTIKVGCEQVAGHVQISVADKGLGISKDDMKRLFERYYRARGNENKHIAGFGIGLYLCSEIIKGHNGRIWAESQPGKGSTFYFTLPLAS
jgi:PAS domain S-box-containing protein